jgi:hypothetical protein
MVTLYNFNEIVGLWTVDFDHIVGPIRAHRDKIVDMLARKNTTS